MWEARSRLKDRGAEGVGGDGDSLVFSLGLHFYHLPFFISVSVKGTNVKRKSDGVGGLVDEEGERKSGWR